MSKAPQPAATTPTTELWHSAVQDCLHGLPAYCLPTPEVDAELQGRLFDLRRRLVDMLVREYALPAESTEAKEEGQTREYDREQEFEDMLRHRLPPLAVQPGPFVPVFSAWRSAVIAILGLLAGSTLAQGLMLGGLPLGGGMAVLCGMAGVGLALQAAHALVRAKAAGALSLPWGQMAWSKAARLCRWAFGAAVLLTLLRDFFSAREVLANLLTALGAFLGQGQVLPLLASVWGTLLWLALFALCLHRPMPLDKEAFARRVEDAACHWWGGASVAAAALAELALLRRDDRMKQWRQAGGDLYSFAAELPPARREWLEDRLRLLGLEAPREQGPLLWEPGLAELYDVLGHVEQGDRCFVDQPPLLDKGHLLRRGVLRKVRG